MPRISEKARILQHLHTLRLRHDRRCERLRVQAGLREQNSDYGGYSDSEDRENNSDSDSGSENEDKDTVCAVRISTSNAPQPTNYYSLLLNRLSRELRATTGGSG
jgi:hypothetical protein